MSDLIGRFLSFEDHFGRGLVKFAYYLGLAFLVITHAYWILKDVFTLHLGDAIVTFCHGILAIVLIRVASELALSLFSIDENLQNGMPRDEGFEAGITPTPGSVQADTPQEARSFDDPSDDTSPESSDPTPSA